MHAKPYALKVLKPFMFESSLYVCSGFVEALDLPGIRLVAFGTVFHGVYDFIGFAVF